MTKADRLLQSRRETMTKADRHCDKSLIFSSLRKDIPVKHKHSRDRYLLKSEEIPEKVKSSTFEERDSLREYQLSQSNRGIHQLRPNEKYQELINFFHHELNRQIKQILSNELPMKSTWGYLRITYAIPYEVTNGQIRNAIPVKCTQLAEPYRD